MGVPAVGAEPDGRLAVFVVDRAAGTVEMAVQTHPSGPFGELRSLGNPDPSGQPASGLAVAPNADGRLEVFAANEHGGISTRYQTTPGGAFELAWHDLYGRITGIPTAADDRDGRIELIARDRYGGGLTNWYQLHPNGRFTGPERSLPAAHFTGDPELARNADGRLEVFARHAGDGDVRADAEPAPGQRFGKTWTALGAQGGEGTPDVTTNADGRLEVFARDRRRGIATTYQHSPGGPFDQRWTDLGGDQLGLSPLVLPDAVARIEMLAISDPIHGCPLPGARHLYEKYQQEPNGHFVEHYRYIGLA